MEEAPLLISVNVVSIELMVEAHSPILAKEGSIRLTAEAPLLILVNVILIELTAEARFQISVNVGSTASARGAHSHLLANETTPWRLQKKHPLQNVDLIQLNISACSDDLG